MSLEQTLNKIGYAISLPSTAWNEKLASIQKLGSILKTEGQRMSGAEIDMNIKMGLCAATNDNRSQLVIEACGVIALMCEVLQQKIDVVAGDIFLTIFEKAASGNSVISQSIANCCLNMVNVVCMERVISHMERFLNSRSDKVQISAANCIYAMVSQWPEQCIRRHHSTFSHLMDIGCKAARSNVRQVMRTASEQYNSAYGTTTNDIRTTPSRRLHMSSAGGPPTPSKETTIKHVNAGSSLANSAGSPLMKGFVPPSRTYYTPRSVEVASKKTGVEPRNLAGGAQSTPRTGRQTPSYMQSNKSVSSRLSGASSASTVTTPTPSRWPASPAQPHRPQGYTSLQNSSSKPSGGHLPGRVAKEPDRVLVGSYADFRSAAGRSTATTAGKVGQYPPTMSSTTATTATTTTTTTTPSINRPQASNNMAMPGANPSSSMGINTLPATMNTREAGQYGMPERHVNIDELIQKMSELAMEESELLAKRVLSIKSIVEMSKESDKMMMIGTVISSTEEVIQRLQYAMNDIKSRL